MAAKTTLPPRWTLTDSQLRNTASMRDGFTYEQEQRQRRLACGFIQELGEYLNANVAADNRGKLSQLCMTASMTHLHRFFVHHSFKMFDGRDVAAAVLFLSGKTEECPRKLEHVVRAWFGMKYPTAPRLDPKSDRYTEAAAYIVTLENIVLMTVAFDINVSVPHAHVVSFFNSQYFAEIVKHNKALGRQIQPKDVAEVAYFYASDILHVTTFVLQHPPHVLSAVVCYLAVLHSGMEVPHVDGEQAWWKRIAPHLEESVLFHIANVFADFYEANKESLMLNRNRMRVNRERTAAQKQQTTHQHLTPATTPTSTSGAPHKDLDRPPSPPLHMKRIKTEPSIKIDMATYMAKRQTGAPLDRPPPPPSSSFIPDVRNAVMPAHEPQSPPLSADASVTAPPPMKAEQLAAEAKEKERRARHAAEKEKRHRHEEHKRESLVPPPPPMPLLAGVVCTSSEARPRTQSSSRTSEVGTAPSSKERKRAHESTHHHRHSSHHPSAEGKRSKHEAPSKPSSSRPPVSSAEQMSRVLNGDRPVPTSKSVPASKPVPSSKPMPSSKAIPSSKPLSKSSSAKPRAVVNGSVIAGDLEDGELSD